MPLNCLTEEWEISGLIGYSDKIKPNVLKTLKSNKQGGCLIEGSKQSVARLKRKKRHLWNLGQSAFYAYGAPQAVRD